MKSKRYIISVLLFISLTPVIFSWVTYLYSGRFHWATSNHGVLLNPPLTISFLKHDNGPWQVVYRPAHCPGKNASQILKNLESVRQIQGENQKRVGLTLLLDEPCDIPVHSFRQLKLNRQQMTSLQLQPGQIYLVDPLNNVFMSYADNVNPMDIFKDLKRVLNASQIG
jgi:hypothetical protein